MEKALGNKKEKAPEEEAEETSSEEDAPKKESVEHGEIGVEGILDKLYEVIRAPGRETDLVEFLRSIKNLCPKHQSKIREMIRKENIKKQQRGGPYIM